jgi:hypothetical protein
MTPVQHPNHTPLTSIRVMQTRNLTPFTVLQPRHHHCMTSTAPADSGHPIRYGELVAHRSDYFRVFVATCCDSKEGKATKDIVA